MDHRKRSHFWLLNALGWACVGGLLVVVRAGVVPIEFMVGVKLAFVALGFAVSLGLREVYRRLLSGSASPTTVIMACVLCSGLCAVLWTIAYNLVLGAAAPRFLEMPYPLDTVRQLLGGAVQHTFILLAWSTLYFGVRYRQGLQEERALATRAEADAHQAELRTLRYQLNPHFLFNTLNSISTLVHQDPDAAEQMIARLASFLRRGLEGAATPMVPLAEEVDVARQYLAIEQIRFGERLAVEIRVDSSVQDVQVPSLLLQPLVENAIHHAIAMREHGGRIVITAQPSTDTMFRLSVADSGGDQPSAFKASENGIGLANTRSRLQQTYGANHTFSIAHTDGKGTRVMMELPMGTAALPGMRGSHDS